MSALSRMTSSMIVVRVEDIGLSLHESVIFRAAGMRLLGNNLPADGLISGRPLLASEDGLFGLVGKVSSGLAMYLIGDYSPTAVR